ncbi:hypothetical protein GCM10012289_38310 [Nonomuraea cavernae]|uniref:Uncharacterized protein n=1 Tax=Nonomuraea cavernae TaxID=2045107 RepID=A0A918DKF5_9ACTN|nr:hypothetical protein GCM10012289_38310 [Nonomuraea cavernae]
MRQIHHEMKHGHLPLRRRQPSQHRVQPVAADRQFFRPWQRVTLLAQLRGRRGVASRNRLCACLRATPNSHVLALDRRWNVPADRHTASIVSCRISSAVPLSPASRNRKANSGSPYRSYSSASAAVSPSATLARTHASASVLFIGR